VTPRIVVLAAPSGGGKTTIMQALLARRPDVGYSVSATTRAPRPGEVDGVAYHFLSRAEFARRRDAGEFVEWAEYAGEWYGTLRGEVDRVLGSGRHVVLDIEVQGAAQVERRYPPPASIGIFILPPSAAVWTQRLLGRGTEAPAALARRVEQAVAEVRQSLTWRHIVINDDVARAVAEVSQIIDEDGARPHRPRAEQVAQLVEQLVLEADRLRHMTKGA
jgi:guanylate kinase